MKTALWSPGHATLSSPIALTLKWTHTITTTERIASKIIDLLRDQWDFKKIDEMAKVTSDQLQALWESVRKIDHRQEQLNDARVRALKAKLSTYVAHSKESGD